MNLRLECIACKHDIIWHYKDPSNVGTDKGIFSCDHIKENGERCKCPTLMIPKVTEQTVVGLNQAIAVQGLETGFISKQLWEVAVDHPQHYGGDTTYEAIKVIEAWNLDFYLGNALKYICRAGKKGDELEDLKKARWYLDRKIASLQLRLAGANNHE